MWYLLGGAWLIFGAVIIHGLCMAAQRGDAKLDRYHRERGDYRRW